MSEQGHKGKANLKSHQTSKEVHYAQCHLNWVQAMASVETANVGKVFIIEIESNGGRVVWIGLGGNLLLAGQAKRKVTP